MPNTRRQITGSGDRADERADATARQRPAHRFASITGVNVSRDLDLAKVYISVMGTPEEQRETMRGLRHAAGFLRHERRSGKRAPCAEITFLLDESIARGARLL